MQPDAHALELRPALAELHKLARPAELGDKLDGHQNGDQNNNNHNNNNNNNHNNNNQIINNHKDVELSTAKAEAPSVSHIIGEFGLYHLSLTLLALVRYTQVAAMANVGPVLAPEHDFWCAQDQSAAANWTAPAARPRCHPDGSGAPCQRWAVASHALYGHTLTDQYQLVCQRDWLRSLFQSAVSAGVVAASVLWGALSDRYGRLAAVRASYALVLASGLASCLADSFGAYTAARAVCSFAELGLVVSIVTIIVETLGNRFRGAACLFVYTGWAMGVALTPLLAAHFRHYQAVTWFALACNALSLPWLLTVRESVRWSLQAGRIGAARAEMRRILAWNLAWGPKLDAHFEAHFEALSASFALKASQRLQAGLRPDEAGCSQLASNLAGIFKSRRLAGSTLVLIYATFTSELFYMLFIMINSDVGDSPGLNYAIGALMECLATLVSIWLVAKLSRRLSLAATLLSVGALCATLAATHRLERLAVLVLNVAKFAISTLSSLVYVAATEIFPTNLRQTGFGLTSTLGCLGGVLAPFVRNQLVQALGMSQVLLLIAPIPLLAAILVPRYLIETKGRELPNHVDDISDE